MQIPRILRRPALAVALSLGILLLSSCLSLSVNPLYDESTLTYESGLVGVWGDPEDPDGETWEFQPAGEGRYRLIIRENDTLRIDPEFDGVFEARLARLGEDLFLDLFPEEPESGSDLYKMHIVPAHSFWLLSLEGHVLTLSIFDGSAVEQLVAEGALEIDNVERDGVVVFTDSTDRLQELLTRYRDTVFLDSESLQRIQ